MRNMNKKEHNNYYKKVQLSKKDSEAIRNNILNKNFRRHSLKPAYICLLVLIIAVGIITPVTATVIKNNIKVYGQENNPHKEDSIFLNGMYSVTKLDKKYSETLLKENDIYSVDKLEKLLSINIPKSSLFNMDNLRVGKIETSNKLISHLILTNLEEEGIYAVGTKKPEDISFEMSIYTTADKSNEEKRILTMSIYNAKEEKYFIKSLQTEAVIIHSDIDEITIVDKTGNEYKYTPSIYFVAFEYQGIIYDLIYNGDIYHPTNYIYELLESFYSSN